VEFFRTHRTPATLYRACLELKLEAEPGSRAEYSDPGFILLGKALEVSMGARLADWTRREIFQPSGMMTTEYCPREAKHAAIPPTEEELGFRPRRIQGVVQDENAWVLNGVAGHAGLFSNVPDLLFFADEILGTGNSQAQESNRQFLFHPETVELFARRQGPERSSRALGWDTPSERSSTGAYFSPHSIGHLGYSGCSFWIDLDAKLAVVLLTNRTWPERSNQQIREVRPAFHDAVREALR
jgi:CubicO group peptidase (beta-lactamase class C family)